jgi:cytochrome c oxidase subunit 2
MYGFLIGVGVLLLLSIIWMVYRIQTLVSVVKGSDKKIETTSNKINAFLFVVFLVGTGALMAWYSIKEFDNYQLPVASEHDYARAAFCFPLRIPIQRKQKSGFLSGQS